MDAEEWTNAVALCNDFDKGFRLDKATREQKARSEQRRQKLVEKTAGSRER